MPDTIYYNLQRASRTHRQLTWQETRTKNIITFILDKTFVKYGLEFRKFRFKNPELSGMILLSDMVDDQLSNTGGQKGCWGSWREAP